MTNKMPVPKGHTLGPWFYGKIQKDAWGKDFFTIGITEEDDHVEDAICEVYGANHNAEANVKLIVAAVNHYLGLDE